MGGLDASNDYYSVLGVDRSAAQDEVRRAFRRKAARSHPDKASGSQKKQATEAFQQLSKAAEILSDTARRQAYDREQSEHRRDSRRPDAAAPAPGTAGQDAISAMQQLFDECFNSSFPRASAFSSPFGSTRSAFPYSSSANAFTREGACTGSSGRGATEAPLSLSLEEMQRGGTKQVTVARDLADGVSGGLLTVDELVSVQLTPGIREGTRIVLRGRGSESRGRGCAADLVLVVHEALHPRFERRGDDLYTRVDVPLLQALIGDAVTVPLLDGRRLRVPVVGPISPDRVIKLPGLGMPIPAEEQEEQQPASGVRHRCGDLYVSFRVLFPHSVSPQQKVQLRAALA